jgi:hypothetical protein
VPRHWLTISIIGLALSCAVIIIAKVIGRIASPAIAQSANQSTDQQRIIGGSYRDGSWWQIVVTDTGTVCLYSTRGGIAAIPKTHLVGGVCAK